MKIRYTLDPASYILVLTILANAWGARKDNGGDGGALHLAHNWSRPLGGECSIACFACRDASCVMCDDDGFIPERRAP